MGSARQVQSRCPGQPQPSVTLEMPSPNRNTDTKGYGPHFTGGDTGHRGGGRFPNVPQLARGEAAAGPGPVAPDGKAQALWSPDPALPPPWGGRGLQETTQGTCLVPCLTGDSGRSVLISTVGTQGALRQAALSRAEEGAPWAPNDPVGPAPGERASRLSSTESAP